MLLLLKFLAALTLLAGLPAAAQALWIDNPGFEGSYAPATGCGNVSGQIAPGWWDNTCWDSTRPVVQYSRSTSGVHEGASAQRIHLAEGRRAVLAQGLATQAPPGTVLQVALWMRASTDTDVTLRVRGAGPPYGVHGAKLARVGPQWARHEFEALSLGGEALLMVELNTPASVELDGATVASAGSVTLVPRPPAGAVPATYFGMHFNQADTPWPGLGPVPAAVRIWDAGNNLDGGGLGAQWADINPAPGMLQWGGLDARVAAAQRRGVAVLYTLGGRTPTWAAARPDAESPYGPGQCAEPARDALWVDWVRAIASRYGAAIQYYEVWNEPDLTAFYCGRPGRLVELARLARQVLDEVAPHAKLVSPAMSGTDATAWLDHYLAGGGASHVHLIGHHFYEEGRPEDIWHRALSVRRLLVRTGQPQREVWNTEQGFFDAEGTLGVLSAQQGAAFVARALLLNWAWGHRRFYFYSWDNRFNRITFTAPDRSTLLAPAIAYREVADWMLHHTMVSVQRLGNGTWIVALRGNDNSRRWALWNPDATTASVPFTPPAVWSARSLRRLDGSRSYFQRGMPLLLGPAPVLLDTAPM